MPVGGGGAPPVPAAAAAPEHQLRAIATQVILSHNACPVCGFPLMWNLGNGQVDTPDRKWYYAQDALKNLPPLQIHRELAFGNRNRRNAEEFHMTDGYLTRDHAMSRIFYTPPIGLMGPESDFYQRRVLLRDAAQHQLFHFTRAQLRALFGNNLDNFRNSEFVERMSVLSRVLIVTCSPCNQNYIASAQLTSMFEAIYGGRVAGENPATENQFYTLLFDSLADPASFRVAGQTVHITVDAERQRYWQCEVWLVRSCLLFFAQQCNMLGGNKGLAANPDYRLRMGSSQMGVCDFLMTQILAPVFYEKYGISVHFVDLHRRFLMRLVIWAKENNAAPTNRRTVIQPPVAGAGGGVGPSTRLQVEDDSPLLLWRWVLGSRVVVPNGPPEARDEYNSPNRYWMDVPVLGLKTSADLIKDRVMDFVDDWGVRIGAALGQPRAVPGGAPLDPYIASMYAFFQKSLGLYTDPLTNATTDYSARMKRILTLGGPPPLLHEVIEHHRIADVEQAFLVVFGPFPHGRNMPYHKRVMYHHLVYVTIPRMESYALEIFPNHASWQLWANALYRLLVFLA